MWARLQGALLASLKTTLPPPLCLQQLMQVHLLVQVRYPEGPSLLPGALLKQAGQVWRQVAAGQVTVSQFHAEVAATLKDLGM